MIVIRGQFILHQNVNRSLTIRYVSAKATSTAATTIGTARIASTL